MINLKSFDIRALQRLTSKKTSQDLNAFLEKLPQRTGYVALGAAGVAWGAAAALVLVTLMQTQELATVRGKLEEAQALKPPVPKVKYNPVTTEAVSEFVNGFKEIYKDLKIDTNNNNIKIEADKTNQFPAFREALGHVHSGGARWRVSLQKLCVGRECDGNALMAQVQLQKVTITNPQS